MITRAMFLCALFYMSPSLADWPDVPSLPNSKIERIGEEVRLNGVPMRMQRVLNKRKPAEVIDFYRTALGSKHVVEKIPGGLLLAQGQGTYFLTIRIRAISPSWTETLVSISDARLAREAANRPLGFPIPADTQVLSDMESLDSGKASRHLVLTNSHSVDTNVQFLTNTLRARGYNLHASETQKLATGRVLMFGGDKREARLVVLRKNDSSNVVLTTIQTP